MVLVAHALYVFLLAAIKIVCLLIAIAYFTLAERKIMAAVQRRVGPNVVGLIGLLQPLADGLKLAGKEAVIPSQASGKIFMAAAMAVLLFALSGWTTIPFGMFDFTEELNPSAPYKLVLFSDRVDFAADPDLGGYVVGFFRFFRAVFLSLCPDCCAGGSCPV